MRLRVLLLLISAMHVASCRTTKSSALDSSLGSAEISQAIVSVVYKNYGDVKGHPETVQQFATALQTDPNAGGLVPGDLQALYDARNQTSGSHESKFDYFVVREFAALTNYLAWKANHDEQLKYLGPLGQ